MIVRAVIVTDLRQTNTAARFRLFHELIGWIEMDDAAPKIGAALGTVTRPSRTWVPGRSSRMCIDPANSVEFIAAECQQLQADLEAEFAQLLRRTRAK